MTIPKHSPLFVARELLESRYKGAEVIFLAGSVVRGEASSFSDLDLVVLFPKVDQAYQESFFYKDWPVEAHVHDPETLSYFFKRIDTPSGQPTLPEMVIEGMEVPEPSSFSDDLKELAHKVLKRGPAPLDPEEIDRRRYQISSMVDDLREPRTRQEMIASAVLVYQAIADFYFRSRGAWSCEGKSLLRRMKKADPLFFRRFVEAFDVLFATGRTAMVIELVEQLLAPHGGWLFDGYKATAPAAWRLNKDEY